MPICNACRRTVNNPTVGTVGDKLTKVTIHLCDDCASAIVGGDETVKIHFEENKVTPSLEELEGE